LKEILKTAASQVLAERQVLLRDAIRAGLEDMAMLRAIKIGEKSAVIGRNKIFRRLERAE